MPSEPNDSNVLPAKKRHIPFAFAKENHILLQDMGTHLTVQTTPETPLAALIELQRIVPADARFESITTEQFDTALVKSYQTNSQSAMALAADLGEDLDLYRAAEALNRAQDLLEADDDAPIIKLINAILSQALKENASDVHIETFEQNLSVRFRVDGVLRKVLEPQRLLAPMLISRIKVMAKLDISERRVPQDGRIALKMGHRAVDVRVSTMPSSHGERVVMRILEKQNAAADLCKLGLSSQALNQMNQLLQKPHGIVLITGPTGAGKTTTLYAALKRLNEATRNILTVEDPIEYELTGIGQTQVNTKVGMSFAKGLRAILRQDPDVVMVGEIRDAETAEIAIQASLTGHLVLSTLHTNSAVGAITRLRDMGIEPFLLASSLIGVGGQRLVRLLCPHCKAARQANQTEQALLHVGTRPVTLWDAVGCAACNNTGYHGRTGIYEIVVMHEALRELVHQGANDQVLAREANQHYATMRQDGIRHVLAGDTTMEEVMRVTGEEA